MSDSDLRPIELIMQPSKQNRAGTNKSAYCSGGRRIDHRDDSVPPAFPSQIVFPPGVGQGVMIPPQQRSMAHDSKPKRSNLTALLEGDSSVRSDASEGKITPIMCGYESLTEHSHEEADSASGPTRKLERSKAQSAPTVGFRSNVTGVAPPEAIPPEAVLLPPRFVPPLSASAGKYAGPIMKASSVTQQATDSQVRRCISSKELGTLAPPSGSPYAAMLYQREILRATLQQRLMDSRELSVVADRSLTPSPGLQESCDGSESSKKKAMLNNEARNRRRAEHHKAVTNDLCEIVTDLFVSEAKLLKSASYGLDASLRRDQVHKNVVKFVSVLPHRYALGVNTPSEVLLHMRLMAAVRSDPTRAVVHITKTGPSKHLVTIACADAHGLLEYITRMLATGGSRVLDADVMLSADNVVLDRFEVQMKGRLRLDKLSQSIEAFLTESRQRADEDISSSGKQSPDRSPTFSSSLQHQTSGPLYFHAPKHQLGASELVLRQEIGSAVPLSEVLASSTSNHALNNIVPMRRGSSNKSAIEHGNSVSSSILQPMLLPTPDGSRSGVVSKASSPDSPSTRPTDTAPPSTQGRRRVLVNREATILPDPHEEQQPDPPIDFLTVTAQHHSDSPESLFLEDRIIPLIPFEELMLIETLGTGRVSTIYRAAWQHRQVDPESIALTGVNMVALKVATLDIDTGDTAHIDELRREADIAAMLKHPNICDLVGVAADAECFCLAYEFCEAGSLLELLTDTARYYEYLPLALDIANGMAYLHSRQVIHRDLKPSNVLITRDHRAKISDFGMSVANRGQELTAETGTYRYMAPEVIRHESYSSNADVYSFGILLWQLITREVPFATMTPIQAAFSVAEGRRPEIPASMPPRLAEIISACWCQDSHQRPSFTYIALTLADYARMAFSPANVGAQTLQIANEMLATVQGNATINVDFSTPVTTQNDNDWNQTMNQSDHDIGLEIE